MVPRLKGILAGIEFHADKQKLFGRKLPSDSLFSVKRRAGLRNYYFIGKSVKKQIKPKK
jgi:hypothetical protein